MKKPKKPKVKKPTKKELNAFAALAVTAKLRDKEITAFATLLELFKKGVRHIDAEFSGSGDSGDLYGLDFYPDKDTKGYNDTIDVEDTKVEALREWVCELFESNVTCDWVNNDGGGGHVLIDLPDLKTTITSYWNETVSNTCEDVELNLNPCAEE
jgi:hypothetical protein